MLKSLLLSALVVTSFASNAQVESISHHPAPEIQTLSITKIASYEIDDKNNLVELSPTAVGVGTIIDGVIAIGKGVWPIIQAGKPVITTTIAPAVSVLPNLDGTNAVLNQMANWSRPKVNVYRIAFSVAGIKDVITFNFSISYQYNGSYKGVGKYITNLKVKPTEINSVWSFDLNATSSLVGVSNIGTDEAPVAGASIEVSYGVKGTFNQSVNTVSFFVDGLGNIDTY